MLRLCGHSLLGSHNKVLIRDVVQVGVDVRKFRQVNAEIHAPARHNVQISIGHSERIAKEIALSVNEVIVDVGKLLLDHTNLILLVLNGRIEKGPSLCM